MTPVNHDFMDLRTRAELLDLCDDHEGAEKLRMLSLDVAREVDLTCYSYQLLWRNRVAEAIELLEHNAARHPQSSNAWDSLGDAYSQQGDVRHAAECYGHASRLAHGDEDRLRIEHKLRDLIALGAIAS
ncbi:MAG TPA: hypothetical protein VFT12_00350 [Thermoanaerobaculia bacterium]|nr:hypothetical protein [Thermoanaerobaculia bacterium]